MYVGYCVTFAQHVCLADSLQRFADGELRKQCKHNLSDNNKTITDVSVCFRTKDKVKLTCTRANSRKFRGMKYCGALRNTRGPFRPCLLQKVRNYNG